MASKSDITTEITTLSSALQAMTPLLPSEESMSLSTDGISLLDTKTDLFLSYLQSLVFLVLVKLKKYSNSDANEKQTPATLEDAVTKQLAGLRLYLKKGVRPLESRLQYQIKKALKAAETVSNGSTNAKANKSSTFRARRTSNASTMSASSAEESQASKARSENESSSEQDEDAVDDLAYRPDMSAFLKTGQVAQPSKKPNKSEDKKSGIYRPPRITPTALPTTDALNDTVRSEKRTKPLRSAAVDDYVAHELADNPAAEPSIGSTITGGGRRTVSDKERRREDERRRYEETNFTRLPGENKKERQKRKRMERGGTGFGANEFGLDSLGEMGERVRQATERAGKRRKY